MKIVAVVQNKGGVGKTTISRLLAEWFGRRSIRALVVDLDPQCNLSQRFLKMDIDPSHPDGVAPPLHDDFNPEDAEETWSGRSSSADIYYQGEVYPYPTPWETLEIIPGEGDKLRSIELVSADEVVDRVHDRLRHFLGLPEVQENYEVCIIDTSPSKGPLTISAVRAASGLVIPVKLEPQSIEGLYGMMQLWRREQRKRTEQDPLQILGILPNMFRRVALHEGMLDTLLSDASVSPFMAAPLHERIAFAEADHWPEDEPPRHPQARPKSVFDLSERDPARTEAETFCRSIQQKLLGEGR